MKSSYCLFVWYFAVLVCCVLASCSEIPPVIPESNETTPSDDLTNQQRQVLIEEFTGVRCVNCPAGSAFIQDLLSLHGERLVAVSIHAGEFSHPYNDSQYNFQTPQGDQILNYVGQPFGYPSAVINRKLFNGEAILQLGKGSWAGYIEQEKAHPPVVKIGITPSWQANARTLTANITVLVEETVSDEDIRLTVLLTEDGIVDVQLTPKGKDPDYVHRHVFRTTLTPALGESLGNVLVVGSDLNRSYTYQLPNGWNEANCYLVAFVHRAGASKEVLQAHEVALIE